MIGGSLVRSTPADKHVCENLRAVVIVFSGVLNETETVDIAYVGALLNSSTNEVKDMTEEQLM